jgi:predicted Zn finger-like uncharacterized protein
LIIECSHCQAKYQYDPSRFEGKASKKIRCAKCQQVFEIRSPAAASPGTPSPPPGVGESTITSRQVRREEPEPEGDLAAEEASPAYGSAAAKPVGLPQGLRVSLAILDGADAGKVFVLEKPTIVIGRSAADLTINDIEASRNHASLEVHDNVVFLTDLGSTNGTYHDGERITERVEVHNRSEFRIGNTTLMLIMTSVE